VEREAARCYVLRLLWESWSLKSCVLGALPQAIPTRLLMGFSFSFQFLGHVAHVVPAKVSQVYFPGGPQPEC
jgi:hypothetical protein